MCDWFHFLAVIRIKKKKVQPTEIQFKSKVLHPPEMWGALHDFILKQTMIQKKEGEIFA